MYKRILSLFLCMLLLLSLFPASVFAASSKVTGDFINSIDQLDLVPDGYTGIYSQSQLREIASDPDGLYILMEDIELNNWIPICQSDNPFTGVFEGNGHTITGIDITTEWEKGETMYLGLFSNVDNARIADLKVSGQITVTMISSSGKISGTCCIGGVVGCARGNTYLDNCVSNVTITVTPNHSMAKYYGYGGIVGRYVGEENTASISFCKNIAPISSINSVGGILGNSDTYYSKLNIFGCQNEAPIKATLFTSGIVGEIETAGSEDAITISACWNKARIDTTEQAGGILGSSDNNGDTVFIEDCLNTGDVLAQNAPSDAGGIAGATYAVIKHCINTGFIDGAPTGSAIVGNARAREDIIDCFWLDTGRSLVGLFRMDGAMLKIRDGALSVDAMKVQENYKNFDFNGVWEMSTALGHPVPNPVLNNTYKETYVSNTITFADDSYRYKKIMAGSGKGSLAGVVGDTYEQSQLDFWNGLWEGIEFTNAFASANVELTNEYDALLADMIYGSLGKDMVASHVNDSILSDFSDLTTYMATEYKTTDFILTEKNLKELAKLGDVYDGNSKSIISTLRNTAVENITMENIGNAFSVLGGVVSMTDIASAGCKDVGEMYDFYLLCNAYSDAMNSYCQVLTDMADASYANEEGANLKGPLLRSAVNNYVSQVQEYINGDISAIYDKWGKTVEEIAQVGTGTIFDIVVDLSDFNPVLAGVKDGLNLGVPLANGLTNMDTTAYYGKMLEMTAFLSKGLFDVVQERHDKFAHSHSYEDAEALNLAAEMYLNVQILACDYAIGYSNSIASATLSKAFNLNKDDLEAITQVQEYKDSLMELKDYGTQIYIGKDGSINGFIANCPVTAIVTENDGGEIATLETGKLTAITGYHGSYPLLGTSKEHKAGLYDSDEHTVTFVGEDDGTMDLVVYGADDGLVTYICLFNDVPITKDETYTILDTTLVNEQGEVIEPDNIEKYENPFTDIDNHWGKKYILNAYYDKLFSGYTSTLFAPDMALTRGMFVTVLARYAGYDKNQYTGTAFEDVKESAYYTAPIKWASENGIVMGLTDTKFGPDVKISRQDMATILYRYLLYADCRIPEKVLSPAFADQSSISSYAKIAVKELYKAQVFSGNADNTFKPLNSATRAEAATVFCKLVDTFK